MGGRLKQTFLQKDMEVTKRHVERCLPLLIIREMQSKTTMMYHIIPVRIAIKQSLQIITAREGVEKRDHLTLLVGM